MQIQINENQVYFVSLGCPRNLVDSEVMLGILLKAGFEVCQVPEKADYFILNTCGFLESARKEAIQTVEWINSIKKRSAKLIVTGCMVGLDKKEIATTFPKADAFLGSGDVENILAAINSIEKDQKNAFIGNQRSYLESGEVPRQISTPKHYAYLKIAEGCRKRCSFCIIPKIKGPLKSKPIERVVKEFHILLKQGVKEIILIAQDLGDYGKDFTGNSELIPLLKELLKTKEHFWLRLLYVYPDEITDELISLIQSDSRICPYLDMPLQHINNEILKNMRRKVRKDDIVGIIKDLRKKIPQIVIRTSLMVGFPGETEEQFQELCLFVKMAKLDNVGIFQFSQEKGAYAYNLPDQVPEGIKNKRYEKLMQVQQDVVKENEMKWKGKTLDVIVEGYHPDSPFLMQGRFYGQCPEVDGIVIINDTSLIKSLGEFYPVKIEQLVGYDLVGRPTQNSSVEKKKSSFGQKLPMYFQ